MIHFDLPKQKSSIIKVIGVGGGGSNAVNFMFSQTVEGVDFIVCNTDSKALEQSKVPNKIQLGPYLTQGLGAGANPEVGKKATEESLEEIKKILEVNTKMAFITVGMGGGTGTGGAPIIAKVCKELGILTVGIVTTPFNFEGPRRLAMAEEGIKDLRPHVDTLLVISNDKLRMQYGNLKMREAFGKADNVLATAAKCITDVINSRGHIIVDFADVCTVMKNGGSAFLGKSEAEGENRAQVAIEEALASPLLNDSDIRGAKWILININSSDGDDECTMDEIETINNHLRMQAGPDTDVIVGMGHDNMLDKKIGITLIATGFDSKDPFAKPVVEKVKEPEPEKIVMTLDLEGKKPLPVQEKTETKEVNEVGTRTPSFTLNEALVPTIDNQIAPFVSSTEEILFAAQVVEESKKSVDSTKLYFELSTAISETIEKLEKIEESKSEPEPVVDETLQFVFTEKEITPVRSELVVKPVNIYEDTNKFKSYQSNEVVSEKSISVFFETEKTINASLETEEKSNNQQAPNYTPESIQPKEQAAVGGFDKTSEADEQRIKAQERINKLRNLSFNMKDADGNDEFETVPAYIRKKMDLFGNAFTSAENFYSKYTVDKEENKTVFSAINTFLDGKKPD
jgi:cell division protein FtsZ